MSTRMSNCGPRTSRRWPPRAPGSPGGCSPRARKRVLALAWRRGHGAWFTTVWTRATCRKSRPPRLVGQGGREIRIGEPASGRVAGACRRFSRGRLCRSLVFRTARGQKAIVPGAHVVVPHATDVRGELLPAGFPRNADTADSPRSSGAEAPAPAKTTRNGRIVGMAAESSVASRGDGCCGVAFFLVGGPLLAG